MVAMTTIEARITSLEAEFSTKIQMKSQFKDLDAQKADLLDQLNAEFFETKMGLTEVVEHAKVEFANIRSDLQAIYGNAAAAFNKMVKRIDGIEKTKAGQNIPIKNLNPKEYKDHGDGWRQWQDDLLDFLDYSNPGMRSFLKDVEAQTEELKDEWMQMMKDKYGVKVTEDSVQVWRGLKSLTGGEARKVIMSAKNQDGFKAWQKLHVHFGPSLAAKQGMALADFSGMVAKPAPKPGETKSLITELERRMKMVEEVTGELISDNHAKSVLVGILDPMTRQHTAMHHEGNMGYEKLKRVVLEFTNNVAGSDSATQIDQIAETFNEEQGQEHTGADPAQGRDQVQGSSTSTRSASQCYNCQGYGHLARECPSKGKGKGFEKGTDKGKGKGMSNYGPIRNNAKGKGKSKGPLGTCWTCGGAHYAANCPKGKGKGLNQVGEPEVFDQWEPEEWGSPEIRTLASKEGWTLIDFVKKRRRQGEVKKAKKEKAQELSAPSSPRRSNSVTTKNKWEVIDFAVDSGASETVISEDMLPNIPIKQGDASRREVQYEIANGVHILNRGEKKFQGYSEEGAVRSVSTQVCEVNKGLLSVRKVVEAGIRVVFDSTGSYIEDKKTHERMYMRDEAWMYMLRMYVRNAACEGF